jgi:hypothetical protein
MAKPSVKQHLRQPFLIVAELRAKVAESTAGGIILQKPLTPLSSCTPKVFSDIDTNWY